MVRLTLRMQFQGLSHGGVRQADDHREGFTVTVVHLHLHGMGDDPLDG